MNFTNSHPCMFYYASSSEEVQVDMNAWLHQVVPERTEQIAHIVNAQEDSGDPLYRLPIKLSADQLQRNRLFYKYYNTETYTSDGMPVEISVDEIERRLGEDISFRAPKVFDHIRKYFPNGAARYAITHVGEKSGYQVHGHFHPHITKQDGSFVRPCNSCVVIIPMKSALPARGKVFFNHQEEAQDEKHHWMMEACRATGSPYEKRRGYVEGLTLPEVGQYLVVQFSASRCLHWVESNGAQNEYLCLIAEN